MLSGELAEENLTSLFDVVSVLLLYWLAGLRETGGYLALHVARWSLAGLTAVVTSLD